MESIKDKTRLLLIMYQEERDIESRREIENQLLIANENLCKYVVYKYRHALLEIDDAMQIARIGMLKAIQRFDCAYVFGPFAITVMTRDLFDTFRQFKSKPVCTEFIDEKYTEHEIADRALINEIMKTAPKILSAKEYRVFRYTLGFEGAKKRKEMALDLGVSPVAVSNLKRRAFEKIQKRFQYVR